MTPSTEKPSVDAIKTHIASDDFPRDLQRQVDVHLDQLQTLIRVNRDDAGHGRWERADAQLVGGSLGMYLSLLRIVRDLANELKARPCKLYAAS